MDHHLVMGHARGMGQAQGMHRTDQQAVPDAARVVVRLPDVCLAGEAEQYRCRGAAAVETSETPGVGIEGAGATTHARMAEPRGAAPDTAVSEELVVSFAQCSDAPRGRLEAMVVRGHIEGVRNLVVAGLPEASERSARVRAEIAELVRLLRRSADLTVQFAVAGRSRVGGPFGAEPQLEGPGGSGVEPVASVDHVASIASSTGASE